ncbi:MAG: 4-hydroxy-tetrahydrodipicolinate synthase [Candidatus Nanopelagicales bacterium]|jgi:4-hydroxy-tetrahydrodipicolinate synthase|nr:4-hydroxy-tetrahydrodipicolinate synthase [Actinomycetota bacterium]MBT5501338.1 4-hydroxy-tetrahydrodipicolinate synthase [Actinomycetota bacterium]MDA9350190.1 4-hydroxy-tetrahydrodipicolinate synthase [Actinomycetota bacterium]MDC1474747.1 4-hydroxy-tetrahydrodipicolinate synthase [Candidatus Nanopelagicales bacterium]NCG02770.1 4-hydroxy-tetrahydrodipicolinate synthase [Actinomycetales bacterium]
MKSPFGVMLTAMITPFQPDGSQDLNGAQRLASHLVDNLGHEGLVINGTTGEAATKTDAEDLALLQAVVEAVGDRATVIAGVGTNDTTHSISSAKAAQKAGVHALMASAPYYNRPPQQGIFEHFWAIADSTELPLMTYDIPRRTGVAIETETLVRLAEHPRIIANKDAKGDLEASQWVMARTDLAWYSGEDSLNLALLALGAGGMVSVVGHLVGDRLAKMAKLFGNGEVEAARTINESLLPVYTGVFRAQGVILIKAALHLQGLPSGPVRLPLVNATPSEIEQLRIDLAAGGVVPFA